MRILYIAGQDMLARRQGSEVVCWHVAKELSRSNKMRALNLRLKSSPTTSDLEAKFGVNSFQLNSRLQKIFHWPLFWAGWQALRQERYDIILCAHVWAGVYGLLLTCLTRVPLVFHDHNVEHILQHQTASIFEYGYSSLIEWLCCKMAKLVILVSEDDLNHLSSWIRHRGFASRLGVDSETLNPYYTPVSNEHPIVLFFGSLDYLPNNQAVEEIYHHIAPAVAERIPGVKFVIAGKGGRFIFEHPNVERVGFIPNIAACIKQSDLVIVPLKVGSGMRMKIIESLACGKTVISTLEGAAGIPDKFHNLIICDLAQFPQAIIQALQTRSPVSVADFDLISRKYLWRAIADGIQVEMETLINAERSK